MLTIVAFSLERYLAICHPLHAYTMAGLGRAARIVALIWLVALISALPFAIYTGISYVPYPLEAGFNSVGVNLTGQAIPESAFCSLQDENPPLVEVATFIFFIVPMGILCLLYLRIGIRIRRTSLGRGRNVQGVVHHSNESRQSSSRRTILRMLGKLFCFLPFFDYKRSSPLTSSKFKKEYLNWTHIYAHLRGFFVEGGPSSSSVSLYDDISNAINERVSIKF